MTTSQLIKDELKSARETFTGTVANITQEQLHVDPGGKALPLGATYAHAVFSEDAIVNGMMLGKAPLFSSEWKEKTGASEPMPAMDEQWSENNEKWAKSVHIDLPKFIEYATAVFSATDAYVSSLTDADLEKEVDLGAWGKKTVAELLYSFIIGHMNNVSGELSVLKGLQGVKGYAF